jgi:hypothetical protein
VEPASATALEHQPVSLLVMLDSSGSMQDNDPQEIRKVATQALVSLLSPTDEVAVFEFDAVARSLTGKPTWLTSGQRDQISTAIQHAGHGGQFTDFRAALQEAQGAFAGVPNSHRKVILLLSDGILEPNPLDDVYTPNNYGYRLAIAGASREKRRAINEEYRARLSPVARRMLSEQILSGLASSGVEVFTVALSTSADREFLQQIAAATTQHPTESHSFYAGRATDLVRIFASLLQYWSDLTIFQTLPGEIVSGRPEQFYLDEFVLAPRVLVLIDGQGEPVITTAEGAKEEPDPGGNKSLMTFNLTRSSPPSRWSLGFVSGSGAYSALVVGRDKMAITVTGLKHQYRFGESIEAQVELQTKATKAIASALLSAEIAPLDGGKPVTIELRNDGGNHKFRYTPSTSGTYRLTFVATGTNASGQPLLPRPSVQNQVEVLPALFALPAELNLGKPVKGSVVERQIEIHSGLHDPTEVLLTGKLTQSSSGAFARKQKERLPMVHEQRLMVQPGSVVKQPLVVEFPRNVDWGDYEGQILLRSSGGTYTINFRAHVPSIWEKLQVPTLLFVLVLLLIAGYLVYVWGFLKGPTGVLVPVGDSAGPLRTVIRLGSVKRGFISRWFNWKRNHLHFSEIPSVHMPAGMDVELIFWRWGPVSIINASRVQRTLVITEKNGSAYPRGPGRSMYLKEEAVLDLGENKYRYERYENPRGKR